MPEITPERSKRYHSISEVSELLDVKAHVLRYWETQFPLLRPKKSRGGSRMYQDRDIDLLRSIKEMLYDRGYTIAGAKRRIASEIRKKNPKPQLDLDFLTPVERRDLRTIRSELVRLRDWLAERSAKESGKVADTSNAADPPQPPMNADAPAVPPLAAGAPPFAPRPASEPALQPEFDSVTRPEFESVTPPELESVTRPEFESETWRESESAFRPDSEPASRPASDTATLAGVAASPSEPPVSDSADFTEESLATPDAERWPVAPEPQISIEPPEVSG